MATSVVVSLINSPWIKITSSMYSGTSIELKFLPIGTTPKLHKYLSIKYFQLLIFNY